MRIRIVALLCSLSSVLSAAGGRELWYFAEQHYFADPAQLRIATNVVARAAAAGYTGCACITGRDNFGNWGERISKNDGSALFVAEHAGIESWWRLSPERQARFRTYAKSCAGHGIEFIPLMWSVGYGSMNLDNPSRVAVWPSRDVPYAVRGGRAVFAAEPTGADLSAVDGWGATTNDLFRKTSARVKPGRRYRLSCEIRTEELSAAMKYMDEPVITCEREDDACSLGIVRLRTQPTQDWTAFDFGFNSDDQTNVTFRFRCAPTTGSFSVRNLKLEETGIEWPVRRAGCPFSVRDAATGRVYEEGKDYAPVAALDRISFNRPAKPLELELLPGGAIADGTRLLVSAYEPVFACGVQASSCLSNPELYEYFERSAEAQAREFGLKKWFLSLDEIRVECRCELCEKSGTPIGRKLADAIVRMHETVRRHAPGAEIFMWSDMIDENHNACPRKSWYYLCRTPFAGAWKEVPREVVMVPWWGGKCDVTVPWLAERGFASLGGAFYDKKTAAEMQEDVGRWCRALGGEPRSRGVMYTTWENGRDCGNYEFLEAFARGAAEYAKGAGEKAASAKRTRRKFVIGEGHDLMHIANHGVSNYVARLPELKATGLDGIAISLPGVTVCGKRLESADLEQWREDVATVAQELPQSVLRVGLTMKKRYAWDDDAGWETVSHNLGVLARFAKTTGLKGFALDEEDYCETKQFFHLPEDGEYPAAAAAARRRGRQAFAEVFREFPDIRFHCSWLFSTLQKWHAWAVPERGDGLGALKRSFGELWLDFMNGCIDALPPEAVLCEGGEERGYHGLFERNDFAIAAWRASRGSLELVAPENRGRFLAQLSVSFGQFCDMYINPKDRKDYYIGPYAGSRLNHFRFNLAQALRVADDYVWIYGERGTWVDWKQDLSKPPRVDTEPVFYQKTWDEQLPGFNRMIRIAKGDYSPLEEEIGSGRMELVTGEIGQWTRDQEPEADRFVRKDGELVLNGSGCFVKRIAVKQGDDVYFKCEVNGGNPRIGVSFLESGKDIQEKFGRAQSVAPEEGWVRGEWTEIVHHLVVPEDADAVQITLGGKASKEAPNRFRDFRVYRSKPEN